jgi:general stress protein 26
MVPLKKKEPEIGIDYNWNFTDYKHNRKPVFYRFDLTKDNRYTLSSTSLDIVKQVKEPLYIKIYLQGDLPAFIRLQRRRSSFGRISSL